MKRKIIVKGEKVQDVGYRLFLLEAAEQLGLTGFQARNVENYVECIVEGEENRVNSFIEFAKNNFPEFAEVKEVVDEGYEGNVMSIEGFYRIFSLNQLVKIVNVGLKMLEKQDEMSGRLDNISGKLDGMSGRLDKMLEKQDEILKEIKELRTDLKSWMEERFLRIEREIARIKKKIGLR